MCKNVYSVSPESELPTYLSIHPSYIPDNKMFIFLEHAIHTTLYCVMYSTLCN